MLRKALALISAILCLIAVVAACGTPDPAPATPSPAPLTGRITFAGSTTVQPLADKLGAAFQGINPGVTLDIAAGGSVVGIEAVHNGTVDIGMASRNLKPEEAEGINQHQIAVDVIAVVVNGENPVENLTLEQLQGIFLGEITNWQEVGGADQAIVVVIRAKTSGTRGAFDEIVLEKQEPAAPNVETAMTAGDAAAAVAGERAAIGYVGFGNIETGLKLVSIGGVLPSEETARDGSYRLIRPLLLLTGPLTQPLGHTFVDFATDAEGQALVKESGWVPVR
ncbi:MAG: phosphate ABC transporter substrate-binding protein [Anaerolineae bacterium]|nr:phosphate ABC transporter substrate-binding protein [Anaerolineae bacterium]